MRGGGKTHPRREFRPPQIHKGMTFGLYFISRQLEDGEAQTISEAVSAGEFFKVTKKVEREIKGSYLKKLYDMFPRIQLGDIEDAFDDAVKQVKKRNLGSAGAVKRAVRKEMEKNLSGINKKKKGVGKSLSCIKAIKSSLADGQSVADLMRRAEKILTSQEMRVLKMCSDGKPVRKIAEEIGTSFPTAWRTLNSALDKMRVSHGMRPRHLDRRGKA